MNLTLGTLANWLAAEVPTQSDGGMATSTIILIVVIAVVVLGFFAFIGIYNALVAMRNRVRESWAQIEVQLKRRYDLIPNLVETVKGYAKHESGTLQKVIEARNQAQGALKALAESMKGAGMPVASGAAASGMPMPLGGAAPSGQMGMLINAEGMLANALKGLNITIEQYPDLKANTNFLALQEEMTSTENKVAFARQHYNDEVRIYNTKREQFPSNIVAGMFSFQAAAFFEIRAEEREAPKVQF